MAKKEKAQKPKPQEPTNVARQKLQIDTVRDLKEAIAGLDDKLKVCVYLGSIYVFDKKTEIEIRPKDR